MDITISGDTDSEFLECVDDILRNREFRKLVCYKQHFNTTRFLHCLNVSYISWRLAKKIPPGCQNCRPGGTAPRLLSLRF